jgi:cystathionine beta-lyase/cystathionine gamma-synthase
MASLTHHFSTRAIHGGVGPDPATGAILTPIYQTTTFVRQAVGRHQGYTYSRSGNPTVAALECNLALLEGAHDAACFASGMAALTAVCLALLEAGDLVVVSDVVYGGTTRLLRQVLAPFGVRVQFVDTSSGESLERALVEEPKLLLIESPANPTLKLTDLAAASEAAHRHGTLVVVDNTLLTPALQLPFALGADVVVHSTTKYIEGHNATVGGAVLTREPQWAEKIRFIQNATGAIQSPQEAWLTLRGIKTLPLRMARHSASALTVARFLEAHPRVTSVAYPSLDSFPQRDLAAEQQRAGGGIVVFEVEGGLDAAVRMLNSARLCALAENLGAAETLLTHPASMTHASVPRHEREAVGIAEGLIRLSVGLEEPADIIADLTCALSA